MPKVQIDSLHRGIDPQDSHVHLGWEKGLAHVELATIVPSGQIWAPLGSTPDAGSEMIRSDTHYLVDSPHPGWFVQLDRAGINNLIRNLRKARDEAYGRDE